MVPRWGAKPRSACGCRTRVVLLLRRLTPRAALDGLLVAIGAAIAADATVGGAVDWSETGAPRTEDLAIEGAAALKGAVVPVTLIYTSPDPLG